jgi:hypothetical protein
MFEDVGGKCLIKRKDAKAQKYFRESKAYGEKCLDL